MATMLMGRYFRVGFSLFSGIFWFSGMDGKVSEGLVWFMFGAPR